MVVRITTKGKPYFHVAFFFFAFFLCQSLSVNAQNLQDISSIRVDDLTDEQLLSLVRRAEQSGMSEEELIQMARSRGVPQEEINKLKTRLETLNLTMPGSVSSTPPARRKPRQQSNIDAIARSVISPQEVPDSEDLDEAYFGLAVFYNKNRKLTFEPSLNMPTPKSYVVGPGDVIYVDIYGQSEKYYESLVTPEGNLILENIGPVAVSGKTIEEVTGILRGRLSRYYTGMAGTNPNTFLQVSLGNLRTIQVHMVGELRLPGTFTLSAFSTVFNALYAAGGPSPNGTMRNIKLIRNDKEIATIDVYDFLVHGKVNLGQQLQDQDIILVEPFLERINLSGEVKRPAIFETKAGETFSDLLVFAGGFTDEAFKDRVSVTRVTTKERMVSDIYSDQFSFFELRGGDAFSVGKVLNRYTNRVQIRGAVFREGVYAMEDGLTLSRLIRRAEGLRGEAYVKRATILRTKSDLSTELIQVDLQGVLEGTQRDVPVQAEDIVNVASIYDLSEDFYVKISGEVRNPGIFPYSEHMTVEDLIIMAGGMKEAASITDVEIARRFRGNDAREYSEIIPVSILPDLSLSGTPQKLVPFDNVVIRRKPNFALEKMVQVEGQVRAPGEFAVTHAEERISDLINRAGGLTEFAYTKGATLIRRTEFYQTESELERKERDLWELLDKLDSADPTESQQSLADRLSRSLTFKEGSKSAEAEGKVIDARAEVLEELVGRRAGLSGIKIKETEAIAIDLDAILKQPGSRFDLILEEGDILSIPRQLQTVRLRGDVIYPTTVRFENLRNMGYYISRAGGFDNRARRKRTYVVYANGEVARTKHFLLFNAYPRVEPGSEIIVPSKGPRVPLLPGEIIGVTTGLATIALLVTQMLRSNGGE